MVWKILLILFLIIISGFLIYPHFKKEKDGIKTFSIRKEPQVCFKNRCFFVELALTPEEKSRGLMYRESLGQDRGMLFIYEKEARHSFWMKNVLIPLDIIWLDQDKKVVYIAENCQPCSEDSCPSIKTDKNAKYVLEINGGTVFEMGLSLGDEFVFRNINR